MNDKGHVGFVDSHAKRIGRNDDRRTVADEILLRSAAHLIAHARMIAYRIHAAILKHPRHFLDALARAAIHDAALSLVFLQKTPQLCVTVLRAANLQKEIRAVKAGEDGVRFAQTNEPNDIIADGFRRRRGKGTQARPIFQCVQKRRDIQIAGTEILSPLADTVRLVHNDLRDIRISSEIQKAVSHQPLRRDVDDAVYAAAGIIQRKHVLTRGQRAVQVCGANAVLQQRTDLIAHQRNKRRNDQRNARQNQRRNLIAKGFSRAGRHHRHDLSSAQDCRHRVLLSRSEIVIAEYLFERCPRRLHRRHACSFRSSVRIFFIISPTAKQRQVCPRKLCTPEYLSPFLRRLPLSGGD